MLRDLFNVSIVQSSVRMATPVLLAAMGALITDAAGIINIALEGMMLIGAFFAVVGSYYFGSVWGGLLLALISGVFSSALFGVFTLRLRGNEILIGTALNYLATALTVYLLRAIFRVAGAFSDPGIVGFRPVNIPVIKDIPLVGELVSGYTPLVYVSWVLVLGLYMFLYKSKRGVHLRAVGENADAASSVGIKVKGIQYFAVICSGIFCALAGAYLSLGQLAMFTENMSANRGFMGFSANIFGMGTPLGITLASALFGVADAVAMRLQGLGAIPSQIILMLPPILTVLMLLYSSFRKRLRLKKVKERNLKVFLSGRPDAM